MISEGLMEKLSVTGLCDDSRRVNLPVALSRLVPLLLSVRLWLPKD